MTFLHISVQRGETTTHDERSAPGFIISLEIFGLVLELWVGIRRR